MGRHEDTRKNSNKIQEKHMFDSHKITNRTKILELTHVLDIECSEFEIK